MPEFTYQEPFPLGRADTKYRLLTKDHISIDVFDGKEILRIDPRALTFLANEAIRESSFLLSSYHLEKLAAILDDSEASPNDRYVALALLRNAEIAAERVFPLCQDTGTATIIGKKGQQVWTGGDDEEYLSRGVFQAYTENNFRYSQTVALNMYEEKNSGCNLPAQIEISATKGMCYEFFFMPKGGGSSNKTVLFQETRALLEPTQLEEFLVEKMKTIGTASCPPYHLAFVIGGTSPESCLKTAKLAATGCLDTLPCEGNLGGQAFRDPEMEERLFQSARECGYGAQFGGIYFALDIRVIRLPRHGGSCPIGMGVSCSAHRSIKAVITREGIWIEELERDPGRFIPERYRRENEDVVVKIDLNRPMKEILSELSRHSVRTRVSLTGPVIVARDIAHAKIKERLYRGDGLPQYFKDHPIYYAGPAKTPEGMPAGSFGPTTAGRMDPYVETFQSNGGSLIMISKGNRSTQVTDSCKKYGGFYLGSIGGAAALLGRENIKKVEFLEFPELGMEAVWKIEVSDFPAFILVDDKGNDFYQQIG